MIVYHGTVEVIKKPDVFHSFRPLDFGKGFYVTTVEEQARKWAERKADILGKTTGIVNLYNMSSDIEGLIEKTFDEDLVEWIAFITQKAIDKLLKFDSSYEV